VAIYVCVYIAKAIGISCAKFHCSRLTTVQDTRDYASLIFWRTLCVFIYIYIYIYLFIYLFIIYLFVYNLFIYL